jgi:hypothetical protein
MSLQQRQPAAGANGEQNSARTYVRWPIAAMIFVAAILLYTRNNQFPFYYHPDEPGKVRQVLTGARNFNHPLLLLTVTDVTWRLLGAEKNCQAAVMIGRWCSAVFAAIAAAALSLLAFEYAGVSGAVLGGAAVLVNSLLFELAHYMKEDTALLMGIALTFLALDRFWRKPDWLHAGLLGTAAGLASSGKYIGVIMIGIAAGVLIGRWRSIRFAPAVFLAFALACLATIALINHRIFIDWQVFVSGLRNGVAALSGPAGIQTRVAPGTWLGGLRNEVVSPLWLFIAWWLMCALRRETAARTPRLLLIFFPVAYGVLLSFTTMQEGRYLLPILGILYLLAGLGLVDLWNHFGARGLRRWRPLIALLAVYSGLLAIKQIREIDNEFQQDARAELVRFINDRLPADAVIVEDLRVGIPYQDAAFSCPLPPPIQQSLRGSFFVADLGTLDQLRAAGVTHVAVRKGIFDRYLRPANAAASGQEKEFARRKEFYQKLLQENETVWFHRQGKVRVMNPDLRLVQIASPASQR